MASVDLRVGAVRDSITSVSGYWGEWDPLYWTGGAGYNTALRFTNVTIPQGATITSAKLTVYSAANMYGATSNDEVTVAAEDVDDTSVLASQSDHDTRKSNTTTAEVDWYVWEANGPLSDADQPVESPDLSDIVQEVVDRAGWESGNAIRFFVEDKGTFDNSLGMRSYYNGVSASYPRLEVEYEESTSVTPAAGTASATGKVAVVTTITRVTPAAGGASVAGATPTVTVAATAALTPDGFVSASGVEDQSAGTTNLHLAVDDSPDDSDGDTTYLVNSGDADGHAWLALSGTPANYGSMTSVSVRARARREA